MVRREAMEFESDTENAAMTARTSGLGPVSAAVLDPTGANVTPNGRDPDRLNGMFETIEAAGQGADGGTLGD